MHCPRPQPVWLITTALLVLLTAHVVSGQELQFALADSGLQSLSYGDWNLVNSTIDGGFGAGNGNVTVQFTRADGTTYSGNGNWASSAMDYATGTLTLNFAWGHISVCYAKALSNRMEYRITVTNDTVDTLSNLTFYLARFITPNTPMYHDARVGWSTMADLPPMGLSFQSGPGATLIDYSGSSRLVLTNESPDATWFSPSAGGSGSGFLGIVSMAPVSAHESKSATLGMRFGPNTAGILDLAGDVYQRFDAAYPLRMNWPDRRLISRMFLSSTIPHPSDGKNPRGWMNNANDIDVIDPVTRQVIPAGYPHFRDRMLTFVDTYISRMLTLNGTGVNSQGVMVWDIEGQEYPHAISYPGDPDMVNELAPEMNYTDVTYTTSVADEIFSRFRNAGFKVGVCVRPQKMVYQGSGWYTQVDQADYGQEVYDDVTYARNRWGCTMFYVDSTVVPWTGGSALPGHSLWSPVMDAYPDILLMGENQIPTYYGYGAPYDQTNLDGLETPWNITEMYQGAATGLALYQYSSVQHDPLLASVKRGDILLSDTWYDNADATAAMAIYAEAGVRPSVEVTSPAPATTFTNPQSIDIEATASCPGKTISVVEFYAGPIKIGEDVSSPYVCTWSGFIGGRDYSFYAKAIASDGCSTVSMPVGISINSDPCAAPIISPAPGTYSEAVLVTVSSATDGATICYTTDGSEPTVESAVYSGPIICERSTTVKAKAFKTGYLESAIASAAYTISHSWQQIGSTITETYATPDAASSTPAFSPIGNMPAELAIAFGLIPDMKVTYGLDMTGITGYGTQKSGHPGLALFVGSTPTGADGLFTGAYYEDYKNRGALVGNKAEMPTPGDPNFADPSSFNVSVEVINGVATTTLAGYDSKSYMFTPGDSSAWLGQTNFAAFHSGPGVNYEYGRAFVKDIAFFRRSGAKTSAPVFSPNPAFVYNGSVQVSISCASPSALIYYTTDGSYPGPTASTYTEPITLISGAVIRARAVAPGLVGSDAVTATYNVKLSSPSITPAGGTFGSAQTVTISGPSGSTIRYTTDGTNPTTSSLEYTGPITVSSTTFLKARAFKDGSTDSDVSAASFVISDITDSLYSRWDFESVTTDTAPLGSPNNGTLRNGASYSSDARVGTASLSLVSTSRQCVSISDGSDLDPTDKITVCAWVKAADWNSNRHIIQKGSTGAQYRLTAEAGLMKFEVNTGGIARAATAALPTAGTWHHIAGAYDGANINLYIDGVRSTTPASGAISTTTSALYIGALSSGDQNTGNFFSGLIDDVRIYKGKSLSQGEIQVLCDSLPTITRDRLSEVKMLPVGTSVSLTSAKVAITEWNTYSDGSMYVSELDRTCGMKLLGVNDAILGENLLLTGLVDTDDNGERVLRVSSVDGRTQGAELGALGMSNRALTASGQLVRVWGKVIEKTSSYLTIDDGSGSPVVVLTDGLVNPIIVTADLDDYVSATGPSCLAAGGFPAVRIRSGSDIATY